MTGLAAEEYIEQAFLFKTLAERLGRSEAIQDILQQVREEVLATTKLPMAIDFLKAELGHVGVMGSAMRRLSHYFAPYQTFLVESAEDDRSRFDLRAGLLALQHDAELRARQPTPATLFFFQFETLCRNRLDYVRGLTSMAQDPQYDGAWRKWIDLVRRQLGLIDLADLVYVTSQYYVEQQRRRGAAEEELPEAVLFGVQEGRIALANRRKDPLLLFESLQRHLGYPKVPRLQRKGEDLQEQLHKMARRLERIELRLKLLEEEQRESGIDLSRFYQGKMPPPVDDSSL